MEFQCINIECGVYFKTDKYTMLDESKPRITARTQCGLCYGEAKWVNPNEPLRRSN